ncbi:hypothetical protein Tco_1092524 [Tanacetum coccineum]|uniref:Uncharacterized protein n=1 Tax=Tanacetum coccineum TaxID=301880 RepID=A0ABQ5IA42_9ASTR
MAFMSSPSSTNEVNTTYGVSTANTQVSTASTQVSTANLSDATVYAFLANQPNRSQLVYEDLEQIHEEDVKEKILKWQLHCEHDDQEGFLEQYGRKDHINGVTHHWIMDNSNVRVSTAIRWILCKGDAIDLRTQIAGTGNQDKLLEDCNCRRNFFKAMMAIDGADFDWSYMADDEVPTNMALMAFQTLRIEFNKFEFNLATYKRVLTSVEVQLVFYKKNELENLKQEKESNQLKIENFDNASKSLDKLIGSQITNKSRKAIGLVSYNVVPPLHTGLFSPPNLDLSYSDLEEFQQPEFEGYGPKTSKSVSEDISNEVRESPDALLVEELADCNYHQKERVLSGNTYTRVNYNYSAKQVHPSAHRNIVPRAVLMKIGLRSLNIARPINTPHPKTTVYSARPMSHFSKSAQSTVKRPYQIRTTLTNKNFSQKVNTAKGKFYTARPKAVNTARLNSAVVNAVRTNQGHPKKEDQGYVDSGCSRHMTGNMSYLSDFKEFDGGYVIEEFDRGYEYPKC